MHPLLMCAALLLQDAKPPEGFWPQTLSAWAQTVSGVAVLAGGVWALNNYFKAQRLKAAEILLKMEEEFRLIQPTYLWIENGSLYKRKLRPALHRLLDNDDPEDDDAEVLAAIDRCLRFFVLCKVLNQDLGVEGNTLLRAYYYYLGVLAKVTDPRTKDPKAGEAVRKFRRGKFSAYLEEYYPMLCDWVDRNRALLISLSERNKPARGVRAIFLLIKRRMMG